jgi:hypothetical protein
MRDIRSDLRERLETVTAEVNKLKAKLSDLETTQAGIKMLLRQEEDHFSSLSSPLFPADEAATGTGLAQLIVHMMRSKNRPLDLQEIKDEIAKTPYNFGEKNPGRAIHFALVGMDQNGMVQRLSDKRWAIKPNIGNTTAERTQ